MYYVEFLRAYQRWNGETKGFSNEFYIDTVLGDLGTFILDGRNSLDTMIQDAIDREKLVMSWFKPKYENIVGFQICKGENLLRKPHILHRSIDSEMVEEEKKRLRS